MGVAAKLKEEGTQCLTRRRSHNEQEFQDTLKRNIRIVVGGEDGLSDPVMSFKDVTIESKAD